MTKKADFAAALTELEKVAAELESDIPIEKALTLFERGMQLSSDCEKFLQTAEQKVEILKQSATSNEMVVESFTIGLSES